MALRYSRQTLSCPNVGGAKPPPKKAASLYSTPEFKAWRAAVVQRAGNRCEVASCGRTGVRMFADHIVEVKDGGAKFDLANGQCLCGSCHTKKTAAERAQRLARA